MRQLQLWYLSFYTLGLQKPGRKTLSRLMPPITAAASTTRVTSSERLIEQVNDALSLELYNSPRNRKGCLFLTSLSWLVFPFL